MQFLGKLGLISFQSATVSCSNNKFQFSLHGSENSLIDKRLSPIMNNSEKIAVESNMNISGHIFTALNIPTGVCQSFCSRGGISQHALGEDTPWEDTPTPWAEPPLPRRPMHRTVSILLECTLVIHCMLGILTKFIFHCSKINYPPITTCQRPQEMSLKQC